MTKPRILLLLLLVTCVSIFRANIVQVLTSLGGMDRAVLTHNSGDRSYSALQPYSYIVVDATPYAPWVRTDFDHAWLTGDALTNTALTYALDPPLSPLISPEWEVEPLIDRVIASIFPEDFSFFSGDNFAAHPYVLFAENQGNNWSHGDSSNPFLTASSVPSGSAGYRRISTNSDPIHTDTATSVPEPSTAALFAGLGAILVYFGAQRRGSAPPNDVGSH